MEHYGQVDASSTLRVFFTTHDKDGGAIAPNSAFEAADVRIYKDGSATQRSSEVGYTMTSPFDSVVGLHLLSIDLSDNTDAGFYAAGSQYTVVLSSDETVDSEAVLRVLADFKIGPISVNVTQFGGTAGTFSGGRPEVNTTLIEGSDATNQIRDAVVDDATRIDASALNTATGTTIPAILDDTDLIDDGTSGLAKIATDVAAILVDTGTTLQNELDGIQADTEDIQSRLPAALTGDGNIKADTLRIGGTLQTGNDVGADVNEILTDTGTTLQAELDGIQADTEDIQTRLPAALVGGRIDATVDATGLEAGALALINAEVDTALTDIHLDHLLAAEYDPQSKPGAAGALLNEMVESDDASPARARFTAGALEEAPTGGSAPTVGEIADAVWDEATSGHTTSGTFGEQLKTDVDAILADTNELQSDWVNGGRLDLIIDAILADTAELQTDWVNGGRLDLILDARASQTSVDDLPTNAELTTALAAADDAVLAAIAALNNLSEAQIRTAVGLASANLDTQLGDLPTNAELATSQASADDATLAAIAALNNLSAATVKAQVVAALITDTYAEPSAPPAATASIKDKLNWLAIISRNKVTQTATQQKVRNDADSADVGTASVSDDGTTFTRGEYA